MTTSYHARQKEVERYRISAKKLYKHQDFKNALLIVESHDYGPDRQGSEDFKIKCKPEVAGAEKARLGELP